MLHFLHINCLSPVWSLHVLVGGPCAPLVSLQSESFYDSLIYLTKRSTVTFGALECLLSRVSPLMNFHQLRVLLYFFKPPDSEKLLPHFLHLNCLSPVWSLHISSIHQILRSSCQSMCTHSFSTVGRVLLYLSMSFDEEKLLSHLVHLYAFLFIISLKGW